MPFPAHVPSVDVRNWRRLIEFRRRLVDRQTGCKSAIRTLLRTHGIPAPRGLWTGKGLAWLAGYDLPDDASRLQRDLLLDELQACQGRMDRVTRALDRIGRGHPGRKLLQTIPGVGPRTAETILAYVDDPSRFAHSHQVGAYFGLVPCQDASAGRSRLGHITKQGPATARKYLTEAAWQAIRWSPTVRAFFERVMHGKPERRKVALIATAHWLLRCMHAMLRSGEVWRETA